ncbi:unnamed protein product [Symbiodinium natans]|uniref:Methyltransferase domain-containing protein n=1 Tax=Symbiodinium natans TaxID=878477 RepID=A0A812GK63_9DINO|nr:unnamed protein product [Symbiodinium natans]
MWLGKPWTSILFGLRGRRCSFCCFCFLALWCSVFCAFMLSDTLLSFHRGGIWRAYFMPTPEMWDSIHRHGDSSSGGIWHYDKVKMEANHAVRYLMEKTYGTLLDVSCNVGFTLANLLRRHPRARHFGTDISRVMVDATKRNCPGCWATQFDLGRLQNTRSPRHLLRSAWQLEGPKEQLEELEVPETFDVILVSDVLIYISWAGIPPFFLRCHCCCSVFRSWALSSQRAFMQNIASLAKDEVVFSQHQNNIVVTTMMRELKVRFDEDRGVWRLPGTAKAANHTVA